ncbi:MAG: GNAT family N-acetyltransferase [Pyrinomonadaceae bacterium]
MLTFVQADTVEHVDSARQLFREYENWLGLDLCFQGFEAELAALPGKYASPDGRLYLAYSDQKLAGCIALRKLSDGICEMKRLFIRNEFRGQKIGVGLIEKVIDDALEIGYRTLRLDTFPPKMGKAVSLYETHGFRPIDPYYDNPNEDVLFMELSL